MPTQIGFNSAAGEVFYINHVTEKEVSIFQTEYINKDAIEEFIKQYNSDYSMSRIRSNMEADDCLTGDEVDYIIEQMEIWEEDQEVAKGADVDEDKFPWTEEEVLGATEEQLKEINENKVSEKELSENITAIFEAGKQKKERKKREPKTTSSGEKSNGKKLSAEEYIEMLQEKIELTKSINDITTIGEIPENLSKKGKDLLLSLDKELSSVIDKYLEMVQIL